MGGILGGPEPGPRYSGPQPGPGQGGGYAGPQPGPQYGGPQPGPQYGGPQPGPFGGPVPQQPEEINAGYRAQRVRGLFTLDPVLRAMLAGLQGPQPGQANVVGQLFPGGTVPEILPPELQVPNQPGQVPGTGTLPPGANDGSSNQQPGAPGGGSELPIAPELQPLLPGSEKGGGVNEGVNLDPRGGGSADAGGSTGGTGRQGIAGESEAGIDPNRGV